MNGRSRWRWQVAEEIRLAHLMVSYWANFARTGDPNGDGLPVGDGMRPPAPLVCWAGLGWAGLGWAVRSCRWRQG